MLKFLFWLALDSLKDACKNTGERFVNHFIAPVKLPVLSTPEYLMKKIQCMQPELSKKQNDFYPTKKVIKRGFEKQYRSLPRRGDRTR